MNPPSILDADAHALVRHLPSWRTAAGERLSWAEIGDRHLWNIVRLLTRRVRDRRELLAIAQRLGLTATAHGLPSRIDASRLALCRAVDELDYRGLLPTRRELQGACAALGRDVPRTWLEAWPAWLDLEDGGEYERALIAGWGKG